MMLLDCSPRWPRNLVAQTISRARQQQVRKYTAQSLKDPDNRWHFQNAIATEWTRSHARRRHVPAMIPPLLIWLPRRRVKIESDLKLLVSSIRRAADDCFDAQATAPHKPWLTQRTWEVVSFANQMRTMRRRMLRSQRIHLLGLAFRLWLSALTVFNGSRHIVLCGTVSSCNLYDAICTKSDWKIALLERNLWIACRLRAQYVAQDKVASIENAANDAQSAADANDSKKLFSIVRRLAGVPAACPQHSQRCVWKNCFVGCRPCYSLAVSLLQCLQSLCTVDKAAGGESSWLVKRGLCL